MAPLFRSLCVATLRRTAHLTAWATLAAFASAPAHAQGSPIKVGVALDVSGPFAGPGAEARDGFALAIKQLGSKLDELDPIKESYYLEVSSPGLDRPLKKERDFARHLGERVEVHLFAPINGEKMLVGELLRLENDVIFLQGAEGEIAIPREKTAKVSLEIVF